MELNRRGFLRLLILTGCGTPALIERLALLAPEKVAIASPASFYRGPVRPFNGLTTRKPAAWAG